MRSRGRNLLLSLVLLCLISFMLLGLMGGSGSGDSIQRQPASPAPASDWIRIAIPEGGSIFSVLEANSVPLGEIALFAFNFGNYVDVTTIQPGDSLLLKLDPESKSIRKAVFFQEPPTRHVFVPSGDSLNYSLEQLPVQVSERLVQGQLSGTLDASLLAAGLSPCEKQAVNNGLETKVNFARNAKDGDSFCVLIRERFFNGSKLGGGVIRYVCYDGAAAGKHELFRFEVQDEKSVSSGLYSSDGKSLNAAGVGYPLASIHVVSAFGRRIDPIYRSWRMHQGVDYRARYGTPVYSVANGKVVSARYSGGWGNEIRIRHNNGLVTQYAHLSSMSVRAGQSVRKGQVIGRVGSTGKSTGAHLHFGLVQGSRYLNPNKLKMVGTEQLNSEQMAAFQEQIAEIKRKLASLGAA